MHKTGQIVAMLGLILCASCGKKAIYEKYMDIPGKSWKNKEPVIFTIPVEDTTQACNLVLNVRHSNEFPYQNLFIFLNTQYPDGKQSLDTLEFLLLDDKGKPFGKCSGDICEEKFRLRENIRFPQKGDYTLRLFHDMRTEEGSLPGITDIGVRIEKYKQQ